MDSQYDLETLGFLQTQGCGSYVLQEEQQSWTFLMNPLPIAPCSTSQSAALRVQEQQGLQHVGLQYDGGIDANVTSRTDAKYQWNTVLFVIQ